MISMESNTLHQLYFPDESATTSFKMTGREIYEAIRYNVPREKIVEIHSSLTKAVEQGSEINLGIVIGQVLCMLNQLKDGN